MDTSITQAPEWNKLLKSTESQPDPNTVNQTPTDSKWKRYRMYLATLVVTAIVLVITISIAVVSSSTHRATAFASPSRTIFALNIGSTISVFLVGELLTGGLENLRWTLAVGNVGIGMATFLALGRATGLQSVIRLMLSNQNVGHRWWCGERYINLEPRFNSEGS